MQTAIFRGHSDDLIYVTGIKGADEFSLSPISESDKVDVSQPFVIGGKMKIYAIYDTCWHFSIGPVDQDIPIPDWPVRHRLHKQGYSVQLEIDVPDNVKIFRISE